MPGELRIYFPADKLPKKKTAHKKRRQSPGEVQSKKLAGKNNQRHRQMNEKEPPKRKFPETAPHVSKRKINKKCGDTGKGYPPFQAL